MVRLLLCRHYKAAQAEVDAPAFVRLSLGHDRLEPLCAPDMHGEPLHTLRDSNAPIPLLSYRHGSSLERILSRSGLIERVGHRLKPVFQAHAALTLLAVARAGRGLAWMPFSAAATSLAEGVLVPAGDKDWAIPIEIRLFRPSARQGAVLEEFSV